MTTLREHLRSLGLGRLLYWIVHRPLGPLGRLRMRGGVRASRRITEGEKRLASAAATLKPGRTGTRIAACRVHVLTGTRYWDQAMFCLATLRQHGNIEFDLEVIDDGSLTAEQIACFRKHWPTAIVLDRQSADERVEAMLPRAAFPRLRQLRDELVLTRKLVDVHAGKRGFNLVLDSDMLFHSDPKTLVSWMTAPSGSIVMRDCAESYGYPRPFLEQEILGGALLERVNSGLVGMNSNDIDWPRIEDWLERIWTRKGRHYFLEQTLVALWVSSQNGTVLDESDYLVIGSETPGCERSASLVHYVAQAKAQYFDRDWSALSKQIETR